MRISLRATKNWASTPPTRPNPKARTPMTRDEFQALCTKLKINDNETASLLLGPSWRTCQRYWYGELAPPEPLARLLRLAARHNLDHKALQEVSISTAPKKTVRRGR
jgi:hypothetical protein